MFAGILVTMLAAQFVIFSPLMQTAPSRGVAFAVLVLMAGCWVTTRAVFYRDKR